MFISREYDYALRILRALAASGRLSVRQICTAENIPQPYAYKILKKLEKSSLLQSNRGAHGGYELAARLADVSLYDVYEAIEGELYLNECMRKGYWCPNNADGRVCTVHHEICAMQRRFGDWMKARSMADILDAGAAASPESENEPETPNQSNQ